MNNKLDPNKDDELNSDTDSSTSPPPINPNYNPDIAFHYKTEEDYGVNTSGSPNTPTRPSCSLREAGGAAVAGTIAGLAVSGPIIGVAAGATAAAVATSSSGSAGSAARKTGEAVATAGDRAKDLDKKHGISQKSLKMAKSAVEKAKELDQKHQIVNTSKKAAKTAVQKAKEVNEKHHVVEKSKSAANVMANKAKDINEKHKVCETTKSVASKGVKGVSAGMKFLSKSVNKKRTSGSNDVIFVD